MAAPPVPPRPFDDYDSPHRQGSAPPAVPPLPPDFYPDQYSSGPHFEDPLVAPRPQKLQPDLSKNMAQSLDDHDQASLPSFQPPPFSNASFPQPSFAGGFVSPPPPNDYSLGFAPSQGRPISRGQSPLPPPQGSNWTPWTPPHQSSNLSFPQPFAPSGPTTPRHQHNRSLSGSLANMNLGPRTSSPLSAPSGARDGPPSLTAPLPTLAVLSVQQNTIQQPGADPARKIVWTRDVLALVDRAQQLHARASPTSTDPIVGPAQIDDPELQKLVNVAVSIILQIATAQPQGPAPPHVAEAVYMRALCASTGIYPQFIPHDPRTAFRDFERAAKSGFHAAWFKLGREYENFGDFQHAKECFERGTKHGVESCFYRLGMAHLMGQLGFAADPQAALPLLNRAATLATIEVPQPAYVYGLLLLNEFSHVSIPPHLFQAVVPPGVTPLEEARRHLERAAYLNFAPAQYKLGHAYEFAAPPFPFDALLSVQYYSLASQQGEIEADMALSKWFLCGAEGAFDKDENLAWTFAEKAARKGLASAEFALGYYSEVGVGGQRDIEVARRWYQRAAQHGNADATERLQALSQPTPQALSREQHENLTDSKLVRKRTQAKQRSEATGAVAGSSRPVPASQRSQIVSNIRKNSTYVPAGPAGYPGGGAPPPAPGAPLTSSPSALGQAAPLPRVDEYANGRGRASGPAHNNSLYPNAPQGQPHPHHQQQRLSSAGPGQAGSPRPAGTPPMRRQQQQQQQQQQQPPPQQQQQPQPQLPQEQPPPMSRPPTKGPQTFAEMGVATTKIEDNSNCVVM
ncbi:HCP-like protein [Ganoderma leucocontextum]|nr:HCP-like protein [Ganoderma leucocontextum]